MKTSPRAGFFVSISSKSDCACAHLVEQAGMLAVSKRSGDAAHYRKNTLLKKNDVE